MKDIHGEFFIKFSENGATARLIINGELVAEERVGPEESGEFYEKFEAMVAQIKKEKPQ